MSYNHVIKAVVALLCIAVPYTTHADDAHYEINTAVGKISVSAPILYAQTTPYVSLGALLQNLGGSIHITEALCQVNYNTVTTNLKPGAVAVSAPGVSFSLLYPVRLHENDVYLAQTDVENFFAQAYKVHLIPSIKGSQEAASPEPEATLDEDTGSLLEVLPLPEPEPTVTPEGEGESPEEPAIIETDETEPPPSVDEPVSDNSSAESTPSEKEPTPDDSSTESIPFPDIQGILILDAGHGGQDTGVTAGESIAEKDVALAILLKLRSILKENTTLTIHTTRDADKEISPGNRAKTANALEGDLLISIHAGYSNIPRRTGVVLFSDQLPTPPNAKADAEIRQAFMRRRSYGEQASKIAYSIAQSLAEDSSLGAVNVRKAPLLLQRACEMPCILIELAYLNNPDITASVTEEEYQTHTAETLAYAIAAALPKSNN